MRYKVMLLLLMVAIGLRAAAVSKMWHSQQTQQTTTAEKTKGR